MRTKSAPAVIRVATKDDGTDPPTGEFEALVSVFGNVDFQGDRVLPGAFTKSLKRWEEAGDPIPIVYSHAHQDPNALLGGVLEAEERDSGLWVRGQLDMELPSAAAVYRHMKGRRLTKFSFAYDVLDSRPSKSDEGVTELAELHVLEIGPTIIPANEDTELLAVKNLADELELHASKAGRVLSARNESRLRDAVGALSDVLAQLGDADPDDDAKADDVEEPLAASRPAHLAGRHSSETRAEATGVVALVRHYLEV
jgi:uncharacterized protein